MPGTTGEYVAHPPLGKIMIAAGEWLFGLTPFGWRFSVALVGSLSILMTARIARRMTSSTLLGCIAGLLMALDGLEFVLSRTAILDIFVMFWVLAAFGLLVIDRDRTRARVAAVAAGPDRRRAAASASAGCGSWPGLPGRRGVQVERRLVYPRLRRPGHRVGPRRAAGGRVRPAAVRRAAPRCAWLPLWFGIVPAVGVRRVVGRLVRDPLRL